MWRKWFFVDPGYRLYVSAIRLSSTGNRRTVAGWLVSRAVSRRPMLVFASSDAGLLALACAVVAGRLLFGVHESGGQSVLPPAARLPEPCRFFHLFHCLNCLNVVTLCYIKKGLQSWYTQLCRTPHFSGMQRYYIIFNYSSFVIKKSNLGGTVPVCYCVLSEWMFLYSLTLGLIKNKLKFILFFARLFVPLQR